MISGQWLEEIVCSLMKRAVRRTGYLYRPCDKQRTPCYTALRTDWMLKLLVWRTILLWRPREGKLSALLTEGALFESRVLFMSPLSRTREQSRFVMQWKTQPPGSCLLLDSSPGVISLTIFFSTNYLFSIFFLSFFYLFSIFFLSFNYLFSSNFKHQTIFFLLATDH